MSTNIHRACFNLYQYQPRNLTLSPWILLPVCPNAMARMHWWCVATSLESLPALFQLGWGRIACLHPKLQNCSLQIGYGTMVFWNGWLMIVTFVLLHHYSMPCGPCSECEHYLVVLTTRRAMVKRNIRTAPSSKLYVLLFMRVLTIGWRLFHSWSCLWTMQWQTQLKCLPLPLCIVSCCVSQWTTWMGCTPTKRHKPL